jgi:lysine 2,3-aminomutase
VIISGGDLLVMVTEQLDDPVAPATGPNGGCHPIGTRTPVALPMRISRVDGLSANTDLINTHFNHPQEITLNRWRPAASYGCGIPMGNQSVLLRGVNDNPDLEQLFRAWSDAGLPVLPVPVRPGPGRGAPPHAAVQGHEIMEYLAGGSAGSPSRPSWSMPHGGGKIPVLPNYVVSMSPTHTVIRNFEGC